VSLARSLSPAALVASVLLGGCAGSPTVERAYEDRSVEGRFIEESAYAAFLRGAIAEAAGDAPRALASYDQAARQDSGSSEVWMRIGAVRCAMNPRDPEADRAFARSLSLDAHLGRTWAAEARCASSRNDTKGAELDAEQAARCDPRADGASAHVSASREPGEASGARRVLVALTLTARDKDLAWSTLAAWAQSHGDLALWAEALERLASLAPARRAEVAAAAELLASLEHLAEARDVAAAAVDATREPLDELRFALAARLAVDEALARGDGDRARARATSARVSLEEVAARAWLLGRVDLATQIALEVAGAEPDSMGARLVLAASDGGDVIGASRAIAAGRAPASAASFVVFGGALVHAASPALARATLSRIAHAPVVKGDQRVVADAHALVVCGALDAAMLAEN
jgi:hypothetical protein